MKISLQSVLLSVVFLTGAAVLVVEVVATRILSPYFGNTIYTFSSVIGVILAALSLGYYFGGKLADRYPSLQWFYGIILVSGYSIFLLELLILVFLPFIGYQLSIVSGPLIISTILFFTPSVLLGMLSPYAITILDKNLKKTGIGSISGSVYFWSTLGSILGSLLAGFFLIPTFGVRQIIFSVGVFLTVVGLLGLYGSGFVKNILVRLLLFSLILIVFLFSLLFTNHQADAIVDHDGVYERLKIFDHEYDGKPTRFFVQDRSSSGAMFLDSDDLVYDYTKYYVLYKLFSDKLDNALIIGGGVYSIPKALLDENPQLKIDVSEIEPSLFSLAQKYFRLQNDSRLTNFVQDGRRFLHDSPRNYDLIFSDVYFSIYSIPTHFTSREFFELARDRLTEDGVFIANIIGNFSRQFPSFMLSEIKTFRSVFPNSYYFAVDSVKQSDSQNMIFVGTRSDKRIDFSDLSITEYEDQIIQNLPKKLIDLRRFEFSSYPIFTDNYAPVDYYVSKVLLRDSAKTYLEFEGEEAIALIKQQLLYGPRYLSSEGHKKIVDFLNAELKALTDEVYIQNWEHESSNQTKNTLTNIIARLNPQQTRRILLGTHYDSKRFADLDKNTPDLPVLGANDSASGTAVLLELARYLVNENNPIDIGVDMVFFDGEEGEEDLSQIPWVPLGSTYFAEHLDEFYPVQPPEQVIVIDMVCDKNLTIYKERLSTEQAPQIVDNFWNLASASWPSNFISEIKYGIQDDHVPFQELGIPSMLIIDYDYPPFHTAKDTIDKCSADSLGIVGETLIKYLRSL